jgi:hypothetical protein
VNSVEIGCIGLGNGISWRLNFLRKESNRAMCEDSKDGFVTTHWRLKKSWKNVFIGLHLDRSNLAQKLIVSIFDFEFTIEIEDENWKMVLSDCDCY